MALILLCLLLVRLIIKDLNKQKETVEAYKAPAVMYVNKEEVKALRDFAEIQTKIDSLEAEKIKVVNQLTPEDNIQKTLDFLFNN